VGMLRDRLAQSAENAGYVLSEAFFKTPDLFSTGFRSGSRVQGLGGRVEETQQVSNSPSATKDSMGHVSVQAKKNQRQEAIMAVLKGQSDLTIKDFSKVIKDCSSKTIQRELLDLVAKGIVKKEGERRWSRYSLK